MVCKRNLLIKHMYNPISMLLFNPHVSQESTERPWLICACGVVVGRGGQLGGLLGRARTQHIAPPRRMVLQSWVSEFPVHSIVPNFSPTITHRQHDNGSYFKVFFDRRNIVGFVRITTADHR
ncbi:hypothetical protein PGTUg99_013799 [Puccinia graminis f. sp. tritici]|uniref:Uncharacterized protein n=1 Tax=Puccinia graminis f. sp. tritici TaxID=56615 RepID=A0A5B0MD27_PUCGR|nr:hypothetical protein PGTUg99_013799 [Puccinia graminis f. sp. tritici]